MPQYYFLDSSGAKVGPVDRSFLVAAGVTRETLVWCEGMTEWVPAGNVPDLIGIFPPATPNSAPNPIPNSPMPPSYMWLAILTTLLCCLPTGIVSIVYASKVDSCWMAGDYAGAWRNSNKAKWWGIAGALSSVIVGVLYVLLVFVAAFSPLALI